MMTAPPKMLPSSSSRGFVPPPQLLFSPLYTSRVKKRLAMGTEDVATQPRQKSSSSSLSALLNCYSSALCWVFPPPSLGGRGGSSSSFSLDGKTFATAAEEEEEGELESQDIYFSSSFVFDVVVAVSPLSPAPTRSHSFFLRGGATDETVSFSLSLLPPHSAAGAKKDSSFPSVSAPLLSAFRIPLNDFERVVVDGVASFYHPRAAESILARLQKGRRKK